MNLVCRKHLCSDVRARASFSLGLHTVPMFVSLSALPYVDVQVPQSSRRERSPWWTPLLLSLRPDPKT